MFFIIILYDIIYYLILVIFYKKLTRVTLPPKQFYKPLLSNHTLRQKMFHVEHFDSRFLDYDFKNQTYRTSLQLNQNFTLSRFCWNKIKSIIPSSYICNHLFHVEQNNSLKAVIILYTIVCTIILFILNILL